MVHMYGIYTWLLYIHTIYTHVFYGVYVLYGSYVLFFFFLVYSSYGSLPRAVCARGLGHYLPVENEVQSLRRTHRPLRPVKVYIRPFDFPPRLSTWTIRKCTEPRVEDFLRQAILDLGVTKLPNKSPPHPVSPLPGISPSSVGFLLRPALLLALGAVLVGYLLALESGFEEFLFLGHPAKSLGRQATLRQVRGLERVYRVPELHPQPEPFLSYCLP